MSNSNEVRYLVSINGAPIGSFINFIEAVTQGQRAAMFGNYGSPGKKVVEVRDIKSNYMLVDKSTY